MNRSTFFSVLLLLCVGVMTYVIKGRVIRLESHIAGLDRQIAQYEENIHVLNAEWAYLNRPDRIQALAQSKLGLGHTEHCQLQEDFSDQDSGLDQGPSLVQLTSTEGNHGLSQ